MKKSNLLSNINSTHTTNENQTTHDTIKEVIKEGKLFASQTTRKVTLKCSKEKVSASFEDLDFGTSYECNIDAQADGDIRIGVNYTFLSECLKAINSDNVEIKMQEPNRAMVINGCVLLMPVMID